jgi:eukaryotic-like serine/threonine-protein kinase
VFPQIFGKYVLECEIASGGMAVVYLATLRGAGGFEKRLVVKQIRTELATDPDFVRRFVEEAKTTVELSHPNIVPVYELGVEQGVYFIAMERAEGVTLADLLAGSGPLTPHEGAYLGVEICRALDYAHRRAGVIHRDVTPRNVVIDEEGHVRLIDFGIAEPARERSDGRLIFGSPGHMAPEQIRGLPLTPAADVFAVGALLIEAWTGAAPFRRGTPEQSERALASPPSPPSDVHASLAELDAIVLRAVAFAAKERPESCEELGRALRSHLRSTDLGDVARRLGARVRGVIREGPSPGDGRIGGKGATGSPTPVTPAIRDTNSRLTPATQPITRTFAARDQLVAWTGARPPESPANREEPRDDASKVKLRPRSWRAPLGLGAAVLAVVVVSWGLGVPPFMERSEAGSSQASPPESSEGTSAGVGGRSPGEESARQDAGEARAEARVHHDRGEPRLETSSAGPAAPGRVDARASGTASPTERSASAEGSPSAEPSEVSLLGRMTFTSDLPARVIIDGSPVGTTPVRQIGRAAGRHRVTFQCTELDEALSTTVELRAGGSAAVHAEFTRAVPVVRLRSDER